MASHVRSASILAQWATKADGEEFIELARRVGNQLANENGILGNLKIRGRLVEAAPVGEAVILGDLQPNLCESVAVIIYLIENSYRAT